MEQKWFDVEKYYFGGNHIFENKFDNDEYDEDFNEDYDNNNEYIGNYNEDNE